MINEAKKFLNADKVTKYRLMDEYNAKVFPLVDGARRYRIKYSDAWCAMFTSVIANRCKLSASQFPFEVSVHYQVKWAKANNKFYTDLGKVKPNDLIIYDWDRNGTLDHVGFVIERSNGTIKVIEGNIRDTVGYRTLPENSKSIVGFIDISYSGMTEAETQNRIADLAQRTVRGDFGNGVDRIRNLGSDYNAVQNYINVMYK